MTHRTVYVSEMAKTEKCVIKVYPIKRVFISCECKDEKTLDFLQVGVILGLRERIEPGPFFKCFLLRPNRIIFSNTNRQKTDQIIGIGYV